MRNLQPILRAAVLALIVGNSALSLPRYNSRTGWGCQSCHVNPSGGGMRLAGGVKYGREELPVPTWSEELGLEDFSTQISNFVSVGADFRTLFYYLQGSKLNTFFQMQGDVYLNFRLARKVNIYLDKGLYSGFEIFGLLNILPGDGFIKAGKFTPNYGMKVDDHRIYTRDKTGLSAETGNPYFTGAEVGFSPGQVSITGGVYNASDGGSRPPSTSDKAFLGRAEGIFSLSEDLNIGLGGNILYKNTQDGKTNYYGGFGSFSYKDLTLMGEVDRLISDLKSVRKKGLAVYGEADYMVIQGVDLKFIYDFYDEDTDIKGGAVSRYSAGVEFFPLPGVEVRPLYRIPIEEPTNLSNNEFDVIFHFYL